VTLPHGLLAWRTEIVPGLTDREFLARHVQGFERLRDEVLPRFPPDRVSQLTGLSVATLEEMARAGQYPSQSPQDRHSVASTSGR